MSRFERFKADPLEACLAPASGHPFEGNARHTQALQLACIGERIECGDDFDGRAGAAERLQGRERFGLRRDYPAKQAAPRKEHRDRRGRAGKGAGERFKGAEHELEVRKTALSGACLERAFDEAGVVRFYTEEQRLRFFAGALKQVAAIAGTNIEVKRRGSRGLDEVFVEALELATVNEVHLPSCFYRSRKW